jgi:cytoskeleton protein RodZ
MKSVGKQLQAARLAKNWTPELAARETKIKVDRLRDLELDDYSHFTSPAYARGFVRTYARALGLDEYQILRQLDNKLPDDDTPNLVTDSNVGYLPETSMPPLVAHRDYTGLYVLLTLGCGVVLIFAFVLFELYRIGELPRYFASATNSETTTSDVVSAPTNAAPAESTARAMPVDASTPPPAVAVAPAITGTDTTAATNAPAPARALPVDPTELASGTNAATSPDAPIKAVRALPVDPSELTNAPSASTAPVPAPAVNATSPAVAAIDTTNAPRALPVDLNALDTNAAPVAPAAPPAPPVLITSISARQSNARPVPAPPVTDPAPAQSSQPPTAPVIADAVGAPPATPATDKRLILTASQDSFVRVTTQDAQGAEKALYASVLHSGQSIGFDGHKFSINVGVPSAVDIKLDGVNYGPHSDQETPETFTVESHQP